MKDKLRRILWIAAAVILVINGGWFAMERLGPRPVLTQYTEVHFIDVGQGDAAALLEGALRAYERRAFWDGTGDLEPEFLQRMARSYGLVLL